MIPTPQQLILIKGEPRSPEVEELEYINDETCLVTFKGNRQPYPYNAKNVVILDEPIHIEGKYAVAKLDGAIRAGISDLWCFTHYGQKYWRVFYSNGICEEYSENRFKVEVSCLANKEARNVWEYLKQVAALNPLKDEVSGKKILSSIYQGLDQIPESTVANAYLSPSHNVKKLQNKLFIYPFGCNSSQKEAVESAMTHQISVIQGPPGTGKTQTILNIIANLLMQENTVLVVSNNNAATDNVRGKLAKNQLDFLVAALGSHDNKEEFVKEGQLPIPQQIEDWGVEPDERTDAWQQIQSISLQLDKIFELNNRLATSVQELDALSVEWKHFKQDNHVSDDTYEPKSMIPANRYLKLWQQFQSYADDEDSYNRGFWQWLKWLWINIFTRHWLHLKSKFNKHHLADIVVELQALYYIRRIEELKLDIEGIDEELRQHDANELMNTYTELSLTLLKDKIYRKYHGRERHSINNIDQLSLHASQVLAEYPIITSTTFSARTALGGNTIYDYVIMDEASQVSSETGTLALTCAKNAVIVGDSQQLPNVLSDNDKQKLELLFEQYHLEDGYNCAHYSFLESVCLVIKLAPQTLLREHYRCHPRIINFCNQKFYGGKLLIMTQDKGEENVLAAYKTVEGNHAADHTNLREIAVIEEEVIPNLHGYKQNQIGIISPYNNQVNALHHTLPDIEVGTVHKYQGREKDVIILSMVDNQIGNFSDDPNLLNVAVSRAKDKFCVVVTGNVQNEHRNIQDLIDYISYNNCDVTDSKIHSIFDYLYTQYTKQRIEFLDSHPKISEYASENLAYSLLISILSNNPKYASLHLLCHIPLRCIFKQTALMNKEEITYARNYSTHVDFLIINSVSKQPIMGIEIDGYSYHNEHTEQHHRDLLKNHIFDVYNLPLLRLSTKGAKEEEKIKEALDALLA